MFLTSQICHLGPAGPGRSSIALSTAGVVADFSSHCTSAFQDLQVLAGAQQRSVPLELWQIVPYTTDLPSRTCRSWQELNSAQHRWSCGRLFLTPHICHSGLAGPGRSSTTLSAAGAVADCPLHHRSAMQVLVGAQQRWPFSRLFLTPHICHPGPADPGRSSAALELWQIVPYTTDLPSTTCRS